MALLFSGCASTNGRNPIAFDPAAETVMRVFGEACIKHYPMNDGSLEQWLNSVRAKKLDHAEHHRASTHSSEEYVIRSATSVALIVEKINHCTVRFWDLDRASVESHLATLRAGIVASGTEESMSEGKSNRRTNKAYRYEINGKFALRIDLSLFDGNRYELTAVSALRSSNIR